MKTLNDTASKILDLAEHYTQMQGFHGFSYRDIQNNLGIKTSSIHYYFPTKQDLALTMTERYLSRHKLMLSQIKQNNCSAIEKLRDFSNIFISAVCQGKICLCGMLAINLVTISDSVDEQLKHFFHISEKWVAETIQEGIANNEIKNSVIPENAAAHYLASLEGGMLIARTHKQAEYLQAVVDEALDKLVA